LLRCPNCFAKLQFPCSIALNPGEYDFYHCSECGLLVRSDQAITREQLEQHILSLAETYCIHGIAAKLHVDSKTVQRTLQKHRENVKKPGKIKSKRLMADG
jgi:transposase-like protein